MRKIIFFLFLLSFTQINCLLAQTLEKVTLVAPTQRNQNNSQDYNISAGSAQPSNPNGKTYGIIILVVISGVGLLAFLNKSNANKQPTNTTNSINNKRTYPITNNSDTYAELEKLAALKQKGVISEEEFNKLKSSILNNS